MPIIKFKITDLNCEACVKLSEEALRSIPGVSRVEVDLKSGLAEVAATREIDWEEIAGSLMAIDKKAKIIT